MLAAGAGSRLGFRPKGLISVNGEPLLRRNLRLLAEAGVDELVVVLGHYSEQLMPLLEDCDATPVIQSGEAHSQAESLRSSLCIQRCLWHFTYLVLCEEAAGHTQTTLG